MHSIELKLWYQTQDNTENPKDASTSVQQDTCSKTQENSKEGNTGKSQTTQAQSNKSKSNIGSIPEILANEELRGSDQQFEALTQYYQEGNVDQAIDTLSTQIENQYNEIEDILSNSSEDNE